VLRRIRRERLRRRLIAEPIGKALRRERRSCLEDADIRGRRADRFQICGKPSLDSPAVDEQGLGWNH
jgi:hypothetical protein